MFFDALGGGRQVLFASASKDLRPLLTVASSVYLGGAKISNEDNRRLIAGARVRVCRGLSASVQYDGKTTHLGLVGKVGSVDGTPVFLGVVLTGGKALGPLGAMDFHFTQEQ